MGYIPRGPAGCDWPQLWPEIDRLCKKQHAFFLRIEPDLWEPVQPDTVARQLPGFIPGLQTIQPPRTILIDITGEESEILGRMKQKTRYNIHLAEKKEIVVRPSHDLVNFHQLMLVTSQRDGFSVHSLDYYQQLYDHFYPLGACELLQAEYAGQALAALLVLKWGNRAWYLHGASSEVERNRMPTYLLQWETIRWARAKGCTEYDLWGVPDETEETLESEFSDRSDGLWGVYRFKRGFGGKVRRTVGVWDRVYNPALYFLYKKWFAYRKGRED
jgi:lipid II:glycine glycyltransferase (peptidoglycan interpeptide bridge formation enzyme)